MAVTDLLFKQLGFNPADIKKQVDDAAANFTAVIEHFDKRLDGILDKQNEILSLLQQNKEKDHGL